MNVVATLRTPSTDVHSRKSNKVCRDSHHNNTCDEESGKSREMLVTLFMSSHVSPCHLEELVWQSQRTNLKELVWQALLSYCAVIHYRDHKNIHKSASLMCIISPYSLKLSFVFFQRKLSLPSWWNTRQHTLQGRDDALEQILVWESLAKKTSSFALITHSWEAIK